MVHYLHWEIPFQQVLTDPFWFKGHIPFLFRNDIIDKMLMILIEHACFGTKYTQQHQLLFMRFFKNKS